MELFKASQIASHICIMLNNIFNYISAFSHLKFGGSQIFHENEGKEDTHFPHINHINCIECWFSSVPIVQHIGVYT